MLIFLKNAHFRSVAKITKKLLAINKKFNIENKFQRGSVKNKSARANKQDWGQTPPSPKLVKC